MKNLIQRKKLSIQLLVTHCLQIVHFMKQKINLIVTKGKTVWKGFVKAQSCNIKLDHAMKKINYKGKEMIPLTDKETNSYEKQKVCYICKKEFSTDENDKNAFKLYHKVRDHCHYTGKFRAAARTSICIRYKTPKEIPVVFHNGSTYDNHFIIKQLAKEFDGQFECLGENTEKYITFSVPIKKELDNSKTISYKLKFIDNFRFMSTSLSSLVDSLSHGFNCNKCIDC